MNQASLRQVSHHYVISGEKKKKKKKKHKWRNCYNIIKCGSMAVAMGVDKPHGWYHQTLNDEAIRIVKSLEGTKGDSGDALLSRTACSLAIKTWRLLDVCCCRAKLFHQWIVSGKVLLWSEGSLSSIRESGSYVINKVVAVTDPKRTLVSMWSLHHN